jgi:hypothetical protein
MTGDPHPWASNLADLHARVWILLIRGVADRRAPARHPTLATVTPDGMPRARTVVLRAADPASASLDVHTDQHSAKMADVAATPFAALHIWDSSAHLQIRIEASIELLTGAEAAKIWARMSEPLRSAYGTIPHPGMPIAESLDYAKSPEAASFAVLRLRMLAMDVLHLGTHHRRARFQRDGGWQGQWLVP